MARSRTSFRCTDCGADAPRWVGQCPSCEAWNTLVEEPMDTAASALAAVAPASPVLPIAEVDPRHQAPLPTGIAELDRVLGGGLVPGSVTLLGGEPGIGKSTLLLQAGAAVAASGRRVLYLSGEESPQQIRVRAERLGALQDGLWLASEVSLPQVVGAIEEVRPDVVIVDSIQTALDPSLASAPGSVGQVRQCTHRLVREAKERGCALVLVGHVTKDGALAGPRVLEHQVDTVLSFEGDRHHALRMLRAVKHRFGSTLELGLFEMGGAGLVDVPDASSLFLTDRRVGVPGSAVVPTIVGHRPLLVEVQVLAVLLPDGVNAPRRSATGLDTGRLGLLLAVLQQRANIVTSRHDIYALAVGGVKLTEPGVDLAIALAAASSLCVEPLPKDLVVCGEIGLGGELRQVPHTERRLAEAARLGFTRAVVPFSAPAPPEGMTAIRVGTLVDALDRLELRPPARPPAHPAGRGPGLPPPSRPTALTEDLLATIADFEASRAVTEPPPPFDPELAAELAEVDPVLDDGGLDEGPFEDGRFEDGRFEDGRFEEAFQEWWRQEGERHGDLDPDPDIRPEADPPPSPT